MSGTLYIIATPIGNLEDITVRAMRILRDVDIIACEDTRVTRKLLDALQISTKCVSLHEHSGTDKIAMLVAELEQGKSIAYVSDAGTPGVNDPGGKLCAAAFAEDIHVVPLPGPSALTAAISVCGFPMDEFAYLGFVPHKKGRETFFRQIADRKESSVFFESTHRIEKTLDSLKTALAPQRLVCVCRELTKQYETIVRGPIDEVIKTLHTGSLKGEFVLIVAPANFYEQ